MGTASSGGLGRLRRVVTARLGGAEQQAPAPDPPAPEAPPLEPEPLLSVVVPVYQVEDYLAACLDSVLAQDYRNLEVVLVDDGSTDRSAEIARSYVERDSRFRLVQQPNAGLGAARNTGIEAATGRLLAFLDSDDTLPPGAYRKMVGTLVGSGSDFVVGALVRDEGGESVQRTWVKQLHGHRRIGATLDDVPDVLANVFAWSKVFRRDFVDRIGLRFPVGTRYEDQVPITRAYLEARAFDVIPASVYRWRQRDDGSSITQQKGQAADLRDRFASKREIARMLHERASHRVLCSWYAKVFRVDVMPYLRATVGADEALWSSLRDGVRRLYDAAPAEVWEDVELRYRVAALLAAQGDRESLTRLLDYEHLPSSNFPVREQDGRLHAVLDVLDGVDLPEDLLRLRPVDLQLLPYLEGLDWSTPGRLAVRGLAFLRHVDPRHHAVTTGLSWARPAGGEPVVAEVRPDPDPGGNVVAARVHEDHTDSTFVATLDLHALVRASGRRRVATWDATVETSALGHRAAEHFLQLAEHGSALTTRARLVDGALVSGGWSDVKGLSLTVRRRFAALVAAGHDDAALSLDLVVPHATVAGLLARGHGAVPARVEHGEEGRVRVSVAADDLAALPDGTALAVDVGGDEPLDVVDVSGLDWLAAGPVALTVNSRSVLRVAPHQQALVLEDVDLDGTTVLLEGTAHALDRFRVRLAGPRATSPAAEAHVVDGRFRVAVPAHRVWWDGRETPLPRNAYAVEVEAGDEPVRVRASVTLQGRPTRPAVRGWTLEVGERRGVKLRRSRDLEPGVDSPYGQHLLQTTVYAEARRGPRADTVLLETSGGAATGGSPAAVSRLLTARGSGPEPLWSVNDEALPAPAGARAVVRMSPEWYAELGAARIVVANHHLAGVYEKAPGQVHVQTWHGTPLERIGHDILDPRPSEEAALRQVEREAASWDYLVSPSAYVTGILPRALGTPARVLEIGCPRNDLLVSPDADRVRAEVRAELGIGDAQQVLLYVPAAADLHAGSDEELHLDAARVVAQRPGTTVLVRGHARAAGRPTGDVERVLDVTSYPDLTRLYLAADVLVTDYASAMFDFALTDKPMLFLVPDLEDRRRAGRGFYVDLEEIATGPLLRSTEEVLARLDDGPEGHAEARKALRERFAPHDDGHVTERLVATLLGTA